MSYFRSASKTATSTRIPQGNDGSQDYVKSRVGNFVIGHTNSGTVVSFKAFLSNYKFKFEYKVEEDKTSGNQDRVFKVQTNGPTCIYSIGLTVVSHSLSEAILNASRIEVLNKMIRDTRNTVSIGSDGKPLTDKWSRWTMNTFIVNYANLITARYTKKYNSFSKEELVTIGLVGYIGGFNFTINKEAGFYESQGKSYPKIFEVTFDYKVSQGSYKHLKAKVRSGKIGRYLYFPLGKDGKIFEWNRYRKDGGDIKTTSGDKQAEDSYFPFGIDLKGSKISNYVPDPVGSDGSLTYSKNKNLMIHIGSLRVNDTFVSFKPFLESLTFDIKYGKELTPVPKTMGDVQLAPAAAIPIQNNYSLSFLVLAHTLEEARLNMGRVQTLLRLGIIYRPIKDSSNVASGEGDTRECIADINDGVLDFAFPNSSTGKFTIPNAETKNDKFLISFSNIITKNGKANRISNTNDLHNYAKGFNLESLEVDVLEDHGMFEHNGIFYFKAIKLSFTLHEDPDITDISKRSSKPYSYGVIDETNIPIEPIWMFNKTEDPPENNENFELNLVGSKNYYDLINYYKKATKETGETITFEDSQELVGGSSQELVGGSSQATAEELDRLTKGNDK